MKFLRLLNPFKNRDRWSASPLLSKEEFRAIIWHECARCDRNNHKFSLVLIDIGNHNSGRTVNHLMLSIIRRMRSTDILGWFDDNRIGVFLPETDNLGAKAFVADIPAQDSPVQVYPNGTTTTEIYTYPSSLPFEMSREDVDSIDRDSDNDRHQDRGGRSGDRPEQPLEQSPEQQGEQPDVDSTSSMGSMGDTDIKTDIHHRESTEPLYDLLMAKAIPIWKRSIDIAGALAGLIILSPVLAIVAAYIKIVSPGPVFFKQERVGYLGNYFTMWKFRTMKINTDTQVHQEHLKNLILSDTPMTKLDMGKDIRHIPFAGILRKTSIDEIPQLINVLKGEMSLIGPRPCLANEARDFSLWHNRRFHALPGMTGLWQVSGKNQTTFTEMMRLDIRYSQSNSFMSDLVIFVKTFPVVIGEALRAATRKMARDSNKPVRSKTRWSRALSSFVRQIFL